MKKTILKLMPVVGMCAAISFTSCSKDKGNYTYSDKNIITIENIPALTSVLANAEYVDLKPVITSSIDGDVKADDANYSFRICERIRKVNGCSWAAKRTCIYWRR